MGQTYGVCCSRSENHLGFKAADGLDHSQSFHIFATFNIQLTIVCFQAVHIQIIDFTPEIHHRWTDKETPEELIEDAKAIKEEQEMNDRLKQTPPHRRISGTIDNLFQFQMLYGKFTFSLLI